MIAQSTIQEADYVIVGGGTAGLVLAQRLSKRLPTDTIVVIEAGDDATGNDTIKNFAGMNAARVTKQNWQYSSNQGAGLNDRTAEAAGGKGLGGSALINAGIWLRGSASDWNHWAKLAGDDAWSYDAMLPYFRMTENVQGEKVSEDQHGYDGYLKICPLRSTKRKYPLRDTILEAWKETGETYNPDTNNGTGNGVAESTDVWYEGNRQLPPNFLDLKDVTLLTDTLVEKVILHEEDGKIVATGVQLVDGQQIKARKEVIVCAGSYQSPKILELSGIGDEQILQKNNIKTVVNNPEVGRNLADHLITTLTWKLKNPEKGLALGSPGMSDPIFFHSFPQDFIQHGPIQASDIDKLSALLTNDTERANLLRPDASHAQQWIMYLSFPKQLIGVDIPFDGTHISSFTCLVTPTSRGTVHITSNKPDAHPEINKNFLSTPADELMVASALRTVSKVLLDTEAGKSIVSAEVAPEGYKPITPTTSDEEIVKRVRQFGWSISHPMGSCAMGKVVDSHCKAFGVDKLRVVDASVIPITPAATIQASVYATAERAAEFIAQGV